MPEINVLPRHLRPRREKLFGDGRPRPLDRNAKARFMHLARAFMPHPDHGKVRFEPRIFVFGFYRERRLGVTKTRGTEAGKAIAKDAFEPNPVAVGDTADGCTDLDPSTSLDTRALPRSSCS